MADNLVDCPHCGSRTAGAAKVCGCGYNLDERPQNPSFERFSMFGTTFRGAEIIQSPAVDDAEQLVIRSFVIAAVIPLIGLVLLLLHGVGIARSLLLTGFSA